MWASRPEPGKAGSAPECEETKTLLLDRLEGNTSARVVEIRGGPGVRKRLNQMGIHSGDVVTVIRRSAWGGPVMIEVHGFQVALGKGVASRILVEMEEATE